MKKALLAFLLVGVVGFTGIFVISKTDIPAPDTLQINDVVSEILRADSQTDAVSLLKGRVGQIYESMDAARLRQDLTLRMFMYVFTAIYAIAGMLLYYYCHKSILVPFKKLRHFAQNVAYGNLDIPLEMDKHSRFGAFSESFDLMREELQRARENERKADQSKKEMVASLSHDIKTPVASIKAVTELMQAKGQIDDAKLNVIMDKADQIDLLITNMFQATLQELEQLKVQPVEIGSTVLPQIIKRADYENRVMMWDVPEAMVYADEMRLQQVFDNIMSNTYKYGGDKIDVSAKFDGQYFVVEVKDNGVGIPKDDLPLIFEKFYRGGNAGGKSGSGLGLYISRYLMRQMGGDITAKQPGSGFCVQVMLKM